MGVGSDVFERKRDFTLTLETLMGGDWGIGFYYFRKKL